MTSQVRRRQGCPQSVDGHILDLVVVNNVGFRSCVCEVVYILFRRRAVASNDTFHVNDFELTVLRNTPQDVETQRCSAQTR